MLGYFDSLTLEEKLEFKNAIYICVKTFLSLEPTIKILKVKEFNNMLLDFLKKCHENGLERTSKILIKSTKNMKLYAFCSGF